MIVRVGRLVIVLGLAATRDKAEQQNQPDAHGATPAANRAAAAAFASSS